MATNSDHRADFAYSDAEREAIYKVISERRDMRHFNGRPIAPETFRRILSVVRWAPSVGMMQPWRFVNVRSAERRQKLFEIVNEERLKTAQALDQRHAEFLRLKVEGIRECAELVVAALPSGREQHVFGRRTLPEMDLASLSCAIQNIWLAARAEGIGMGWVSIFDPQSLQELFNMPDRCVPVAILCFGHVDEFYPKPMLELASWATPQPLSDIFYEESFSTEAQEAES